MPQFGQATISTTGGENGECPLCAVGTEVAGEVVTGRLIPIAPELLGGIGLGRTGTCIGAEPSPIWTEDDETGADAAGIRGAVETAGVGAEPVGPDGLDDVGGASATGGAPTGADLPGNTTGAAA